MESSNNTGIKEDSLQHNFYEQVGLISFAVSSENSIEYRKKVVSETVLMPATTHTKFALSQFIHKKVEMHIDRKMVNLYYKSCEKGKAAIKQLFS